MDKKEALARYAFLKRDLLSDGAKEHKLDTLNQLYYTMKKSSNSEVDSSEDNPGGITPAPGGGLPRS